MKKFMSLFAALVLAVAVSSSYAMSPKENCPKKGEGAAPCAKPCDPANCDPSKCDRTDCPHKKVVPASDKPTDAAQPCDPAKCAKGDCKCKKNAATVSDKPGQSAPPCAGQQAQTTSDKPAGSGAPCSGHAAPSATASTTPEKKSGCNTPCGGADAMMTGNAISDAVIAKMPAMKFRVGEQVVGCPKAAAALAQKAGQPVKYVVGDEVVTDQAEAQLKLVALLEKEATNLQALQFTVGDESFQCPMSAKSAAEKNNAGVAYRVGGIDFANKEKAEKAAKLAADAVAAVKMSYKVDGQSFCCDKMAGQKSKETGKPVMFVVGDREAADEAGAKLLLAQAKIRAIVEAAASAMAS